MIESKKKIIACQIFTDELSAVLAEGYEDIDVVWLDAGLHMNFDALEANLKQALEEAATGGVRTNVLFGSGCHPDICMLATRHDGKMLGAKNCVHAFCGKGLKALEQNRTMVITPGWIRLFSNLMAAAGWDEVDVRQNLGRYDRILLLETGINPLSEEEILAFYELTQVPIEMQAIDLSYFRARLMELLE